MSDFNLLDSVYIFPVCHNCHLTRGYRFIFEYTDTDTNFI